MKKNLNLLKDIYISTENSSNTLNHLLPKIKNQTFRKLILSQINCFDIINADLKNEISNLGEKAPANKVGKFTTKINSFIYNTESEIAEYIIRDSTGKIINLTKNTNKNASITPMCYNLIKKVIKAEQENIDSIKEFL